MKDNITREYILYKIKATTHSIVVAGFMIFFSYQIINSINYKINNAYYDEQKILYATNKISHQELKERKKSRNKQQLNYELKENKAILRENNIEEIICSD
ncbi:hypothetical protein K9L67_02615 [Candidatus Woesearchaeota archaeon]|nr:hypothetical protein [Candidatus Woesearchaeota archaeon]MCF7901098.1 hypothetical protein [Candidatus Woesearchaeota archaeon]MCF8013431.1 hypothetical protein [Candidatus Woesearchaeota archaeon]